jgi:reverse gyrase
MNKGKNSEQKSAEEYFPVEEDYKRSTEKQTKEIISENKRTTEKKIKSPIIDTHSIEKEYHTIDKKQREKVEPIRKRTKKRTTKKKKRTTTKKVKYIPPKIQLKSKGYELIITEKPQAAAKIAASLGKAEKFSNQKIPYYEVDRNGKKLVIVSAVGHLFTLTSNEKGTPVFNVEWKPNFMVRKKDFTKNTMIQF